MKHPRYKIGDELETTDGYVVTVLDITDKDYKLTSVTGHTYVEHSIGFVDKMYKLHKK